MRAAAADMTQREAEEDMQLRHRQQVGTVVAEMEGTVDTELETRGTVDDVGVVGVEMEGTVAGTVVGVGTEGTAEDIPGED